MFRPTARPKSRKQLSVIQKNFAKGVVSVLQASRIPQAGLSDMTNMDLVQDSIVKPRPSTVAYGPVAIGTIIGIGTFTKLNGGVPERFQITMQVIGGVGKIVINSNAGAWTTVAGTYTFSSTAWCMFTQSNSRVYVSNGVNDMSFYDINAGTVTTYTALTAPVAPTLTRTVLVAGNSTYYYAYSANNNVGETSATISAAITVNKTREQWLPASENITATGTAVAGASSYNWYISTTPLITDFQYLATTSNPSFVDNGSTIINIFKSAPPGNSTSGPKLTYLINDNGQLFGVGDPTPGNQYNMWYSAKGQNSGNFSPFSGGGYAYINYGGDSIPTVVKSFRTGKGDPVITVLTKGQAGTGKFYHAAATSTSYGNVIIPYFQVNEANGQSGTISPFGVVEGNNNIYYPTGPNFKSTGTQPNIVNILATNSISQAIDPDVRALNLEAMKKCVGLFHNDRIYWAVANRSSENNEIWIHDTSRNGAWILRWTIAAKWLYLYEDSSGVTHFNALVGNTICEFVDTVNTTDLGVPFSTRVASGSIVWDDSGISLAAVQSQYFKLINPKGKITITNFGIGEDALAQTTLGTSVYSASLSITNTGYGVWDYSGRYHYGSDVGPITNFTPPTGIVILEPDETLNEISWQITTDDANCDYTLSSVTTVGVLIPNARLGQ